MEMDPTPNLVVLYFWRTRRILDLVEEKQRLGPVGFVQYDRADPYVLDAAPSVGEMYVDVVAAACQVPTTTVLVVVCDE